MDELTLLLLRFGFLLLLWAFVFAIVYALRSDLFGDRVRKLPVSPQSTPEPAPAAGATAPLSAPRPVAAQSAASGPVATTATASRLVITSGAKAGLELELHSEPLTIGRSSESGLVIRDDYTSTHHARLVLWGDEWVIQDLDSTNGTFLDGRRVAAPTPIPLNTPVKIGTTSFELRR
ncbi:pSer/pThr/pTyr-binding forkhead associated (FHA) protein [Homoserinimonas aerilata]|uniref:PSer/pThr/pTyr-binding forkhead associated (FHA) protein n=1 Tax=Homoserinimonas aerilata TaxID=1162970 RepID=A0A542XWZ0_9MICO|nr:FHA domain-containing protein [Homoserinimonas aerilata]TQL40355.1 pSer/pThr/pTyr-binding forkhead associated (FHA) protein [Homoserinimonas aerilata]